MTIIRGQLLRRASRRRLNPRVSGRLFNSVIALVVLLLFVLILWDTFKPGGNFDTAFGIEPPAHVVAKGSGHD